MQISINGTHQSKYPDIKLSVFIKKWLLNILLDDVTSFIPIYVCVVDQTLDGFEVFAYCNTASTVAVLARLDDPEVLSQLRVLVQHRLLALNSAIIDIFKL